LVCSHLENGRGIFRHISIKKIFLIKKLIINSNGFPIIFAHKIARYMHIL
jgi:hypothetical protein